jgi:hypothetical protein
MIVYSDQAFINHGAAQVEMSPSLTTESSNSGKVNQYTYGLYKLQGKAYYDWNSNRILIQGECSKSGDQTSKGGCLLGEAYSEIGLNDSLSVKAGKSTFDVSPNPILTSPLNPSTSGLASLSPMIPQEGIWNGSISLVPDQVWSIQLGAATDFEKMYPFSVIKSHFGKFDFGVTGTENLLGVSGSVQLTDNILFYSEGNTMRDCLTGLLSNFSLFGNISTRFSSEYFYNSNGAGAGSSEERFRFVSKSRNLNHQQKYRFPTPRSMDFSPWGPMSFMSQDLLLLDLRNTSGQLVPSMTYIVSLNDKSWMSINGLEYRFSNLKSKLNSLVLRVDWRHFEGARGIQEFGEVSKAIGSNQVWLSVQI